MEKSTVLKKCSGCNSYKTVAEFYKHHGTKDGLTPKCKVCIRKKSKKYRNTHKEEYKKYYKSHKEEAQEWSEKNRIKRRASFKKWYKKNSEQLKGKRSSYYKTWKYNNEDYLKEWRAKNPGKVKIYLKKGGIKRKLNPKYHLSDTISRGIYHSLKNGSKAGRHWEDLVDFTVDQLKNHIEGQFESWMTWDNYGKGGWVIDHIVPIAVFNFETPEDLDFKNCWTLNNLRPLEEIENIKKGAQLDNNFQPSLLLSIVN